MTDAPPLSAVPPETVSLIGRARRMVAARARLFAGLACGFLALPLLPGGLLATPTRFILAWDVGVGVYLALAFALFLTTPLERIAHHAAAQEEGEWTIFGLTVAGVVASFAAILFEFSVTHDTPAATRGLHVALVVVTLLVSWLMTQTTFCFRYAHEFYAMGTGEASEEGGLEFPGEHRPDYLDFLYFSMVLGMTFQVSDVQITSRKLRRLAVLHGFLSFLFNTVILALTVNIAASLL